MAQPGGHSTEVFAVFGGRLRASSVFSALALFNAMRVPGAPG